MLGWILVWTLVLAVAQAPVAAGEVPLPKGVRQIPEARRVDLGRSALEVKTFLSSDLALDEVAAFYRKALPKSGWQVADLPWQAGHAAATERLKQTVEYHRHAPEGRKLEETLAEFEQTGQAMRGQLYASQGRDHLIVNLWPMGQSGTMIFLNRWSGDRSWMEKKERQTAGSVPVAGDTGWPATNVCCSGEEVPGLAAGLPFAVARYPGARALAKSEPQSGTSTTVLLMTPDDVGAVVAYYRQQMPLSGWTARNESDEGSEASSGEAQILAFEKPDRVCELTIEGGPARPSDQGAGGGQARQTIITIAVTPRAAGSTPTGGAL